MAGAEVRLTPDLGEVPVVEIKGGATVNIDSLTVQGPAPLQTISPGTQGTIDGIYIVGGATANVTGVTINNIRAEPLSGIQNGGRGILVGSTSQSQVGHAAITDCTITNYQKIGIQTGGNGTTVTVTGTTVTGVGPTPVNGQNGIFIRAGTSATITNNTISGNQYTGANNGGPNPITAVQATGIANLGNSSSISGNTITGNDLGIYNLSTGTTISGNIVQGNPFEGIVLDQGNATVSNNIIDGSNIGVAVVALVGNTADSQGTLLSNNIFNNGNGGLSFPGAGISVLVEAGATTAPLLTANFNRIVGNSVGLNNGTTTPAGAALNWWGNNTGPNTTGNDTTTGTGTVSTSPWLVLSIAASLGTIGPGGTTPVTASVTNDSSGATHSSAPFFPNGIPITFGASAGTISPASVPTQSGTASSSFTSTSAGTPSASATLDNQTVSITITVQAIVVTPPPTPQQKTEGESFSQSFAATGGAGGFVYTVSAGALAPDLVLDAKSGLVSGPLTTPGTYTFTVTATDLSGASANASLTIVVASAQGAAPTVQKLQRFGFHSQPTTLVLTFSAEMNPTPAQDVNNYQIMAPDGSVIPVTSAVYDASALTVTLHPSQLLNIHDFYQLTVNGTPPSGLTSATGVALDGAGNGTPGTNFVMTFSGEILAGPAPEMLHADPKKYAAESKRMEAFVRTLTGTPHRMAATRKRLAAEAKKMVAVSARVAAQAARGDGPGAAAVDHLLGAGKVNVKGILAARKRGGHRVRSA